MYLSIYEIFKYLIYLKRVELASEFYRDVIAPVLDDTQKAHYLIQLSYNNFYFSSNYYTRLSQELSAEEPNMALVKLLSNWTHSILMCDQYILGSLDKLFDLVIERLEDSDIHVFLELLMLDPSVLESVSSIRKLIKYRISRLKKLTSDPPAIYWSMPYATFLNHPELEEFMKSNQPVMTYSGVFKGINEARLFVQLYSGVKFHYSTKMVCSGSGKSTRVEITKTSEYYERRLKVHNQRVEELHRLEALLKH
jgi:hypothetical protein